MKNKLNIEIFHKKMLQKLPSWTKFLQAKSKFQLEISSLKVFECSYQQFTLKIEGKMAYFPQKKHFPILMSLDSSLKNTLINILFGGSREGSFAPGKLGENALKNFCQDFAGVYSDQLKIQWEDPRLALNSLSPKSSYLVFPLSISGGQLWWAHPSSEISSWS